MAEIVPGGAGPSPAPERKISARGLLLAGAAAVAGGYALLLAAGWLGGAWNGYRSARAAGSRLSGPLAEARSLGLTYEYAKAYPEKSPGKYAVWCLRRQQGQAEAWYRGDPKRALYLVNPGEAYSYAGSSHQDCVDTLIRVVNVKPNEFKPGSLRLEAEFVGYP